MGPWRLELLRVWRTRRLVALVATMLILGLGSPVVIYYLPDLVKNSGNGVQIILPKQTAADGMTSFGGNLGQLGTLVVAVVAAATLAIDAQPGLAAFYRTRVGRTTRLVLPRYLVVTAASVAALALGVLGAWYETAVLLGSVSAGAIAAGFGYEALWLCFVVSVVALAAGLIRSVLGMVGASIGFLLALGLLGNVSAIAAWLPTRLAASAGTVVAHPGAGLWRAAIAAALATIVALGLAVARFGQRQL